MTRNVITNEDVLIYDGELGQDGRLHLLVTNPKRLGAWWPQYVRYQLRLWRWDLNETFSLPDNKVKIWGHGTYSLVPPSEVVDETKNNIMYLD